MAASSKKVRPRATADDVYTGARVREFRLALGLSQTELGDQSGITFQQIQKYEGGKNRIGASRLVQIARALRVAPANLLPPVDGAGNIPETDQNVSAIMSTR